ncbi:pseudomurein-binding repeat-containing protein [Methanobrevibacter curvatus]|uniref:Pseudomurein-binding repeat protein n=1 Tax=Methanobrevibacter curvatus TaxID=49547 RepID=A0A166B416_9EURY|nr:transglutaminase domain-containing protein [Methanobrevibacter curvatus]KZX12832.1 pseudomurein-binding repeat protein [Methanobrevibacter curvatus]
MSASFASETNTNNVENNTNTSSSVSDDSKNSIVNAVTSTNKVKAAGEAVSLSQNQILLASKAVNSYINKYKKLPNYVTISESKFSMSEYLNLLSMTIYNKYNKKTSAITIKYNIKNPTKASGVNIKGKLTKAQYYSYSKNIITYIKKYNKSPNYISTKLGKMQYQTGIYTLNKVAYYTATHSGKLPSTLNLNIAKTHKLNKNLPKYQRTQISASNSNSNNNNNNNNNTQKGLNTKLLGSNDKGKVELIDVLGNVGSKRKIAYVIGLHPLESYVHSSLYNTIVSKSTNLKYSYYIYKINVTKDASDYDKGRMNGQLLAQEFVLPHILTQNYNIVIDIHSNRGTLNGGSYNKTNFIFAPLNHSASKKIAEDIIKQIPKLVYYYPSSQTSTPYLTNTLVNGGINTIIYETYMYEDSATTNRLINELTNKIDAYSFSNSNSTSTNLALNDIIDAASRIKAYTESNGKLPSYVLINGKEWGMPDFLYLLSNAIVNINKGTYSNIPAISVGSPPSPSGAKITANLLKANYVDLAYRVSVFIKTNKKAPNYASSDFGNIHYYSLVYELSKVLNYHKNNGALPNSLSINTSGLTSIDNGISGSITPNEELSQYLGATMRCQVNDSSIQSLAKKLTSGLSTDLSKATAIFNYVRDSIKYKFYFDSFDSTGAKGAITKGWGNCVDKTHLLVALLRVNGIAARYVHGECAFTSGVLGHVWAEIYLDGKWVIADTTHSRNKIGVVTNWNIKTYKLKTGRVAEITF